MTKRPNRPLSGIRVAISISESPSEQSQIGLTSREVNRSVREISQALLAQGASVAFGHDWREDGVMSEVLKLALSYHTMSSRESASEPTMWNFVPWPRRPRISDEDRFRYREVLAIREVLPPGNPVDLGKLDHDNARNLEIANLTRMRTQMTQHVQARVCIGGRVAGFTGRYPGIVEEAVLTLQAGKPLYVTGLYGGASAQVISALGGGADDLQDLILETFAGIGIKELSELNFLTVEENHKLFKASSLSEVIGFMLTGLARVNRKRRREV